MLWTIFIGLIGMRGRFFGFLKMVTILYRFLPATNRMTNEHIRRPPPNALLAYDINALGIVHWAMSHFIRF